MKDNEHYFYCAYDAVSQREIEIKVGTDYREPRMPSYDAYIVVSDPVTGVCRAAFTLRRSQCLDLARQLLYIAGED